MEINEENCKSFGNGRKVIRLCFTTPKFQFKKKINKLAANLNRFM